VGRGAGEVRVLVTGGGGFVGGAIVDQLLARGDQVVSFARGDYPALTAKGVRVERGDLADPEAVHGAAKGCEAVFHVAALPGVWGPASLYESVNLKGTENVLAACAAHGVQRLVYTSTPSVVHSGEDVEGVDHTAPYAEHFLTHYPRTKAEAEKKVLAANSAGLHTVALRPHLIWGPGDNHLIPRVISRAQAGRLRLVGGGLKKVDASYIDNVADAHLAALDALTGPDAACAGKAYFVANDEPRPQREFINGFLEAAGLPACTKTISPGAAYAAGAVLETVFGMFGVKSEPPMTRFVARQLASAHWYDLTATRRDLGWAPRVSVDEGMRRLKASFGR
jgi:2-alkyl-3-oxoalkanoate reductase